MLFEFFCREINTVFYPKYFLNDQNMLLQLGTLGSFGNRWVCDQKSGETPKGRIPAQKYTHYKILYLNF